MADVEEGKGPLVSPNAKDVYVNVGELTPDKMRELGVPTCCTGATEWWKIFSACCALGVVLPIVLLVVAAQSRGNEIAGIIGYVFLGVGVSYFCFSIRATLCEGGVMMPPAPPVACALVKAKEGDKSHYQVQVKKVFVVVNPHGGKKQALEALEKVVLPIWEQEFGIEATVLKTEYAGHARDYARDQDLQGYDGFCVIGGDGSFHEVVNGLLQRTDGQSLPVGLLPGGSGNSVSLDLGTWSVAEAARRVGRGDVCYIDANVVALGGEKVVSVNELSWGLVGNVGVEAEAFRCLGPSRYDVIAVWGVLKGGGWDCSIEYETASGEKKVLKEKFLTAFVNSAQYFGKGLRAAPAARQDDGSGPSG